MTQAIQKAEQSPRLDFSGEQRQIIRDSFASGASDAEFAVLMEVAAARGLNPILGQIHFVKRYDTQKRREVWSHQTSIDGLRYTAERTGLYDGQDEPEFDYNKEGEVTQARVKVYKKGVSRPFVGVARYEEYVQTKKDGSETRFWKQMPHVMLAKCAEALGLRKAFPAQMAGLYTHEEMGQAEDATPPARQLQPRKTEDAAVKLFEQLLEDYAACSTIGDVAACAGAVTANKGRFDKDQLTVLREAHKAALERVDALVAAQAKAEAVAEAEPDTPGIWPEPTDSATDGAA